MVRAVSAAFSHGAAITALISFGFSVDAVEFSKTEAWTVASDNFLF